MSGPFATYSSTQAQSGLSFIYYDSTGTVRTPTDLNASTANRSLIWRIKIVARADTDSPLDVPGMTRAVYRDSLAMDVALRNRH